PKEDDRRATDPRASGEADRLRQQTSAVLEELTSTVTSAERAALAPYTAKYESTVQRLRWSDPRVAAAVASEISVGHALARPGAAEACADMTAWAQSGFRRIPARTREFSKHRREVFDLLSGPSAEVLIRRYEGPAERRLIARTRRLERRSLYR